MRSVSKEPREIRADRWLCVACGFTPNGAPPQFCPHCGEHRWEKKAAAHALMNHGCKVVIEAGDGKGVKFLTVKLDERTLRIAQAFYDEHCA